MNKIMIIVLVLLPAFGLANEVIEGMSQSVSESSAQSARVQIAQAVKRDAEGYLAGSEMTRSLRLKLEQVQLEHPELGSDQLVEFALNEADDVIAENREDETPQ